VKDVDGVAANISALQRMNGKDRSLAVLDMQANNGHPIRFVLDFMDNLPGVVSGKAHVDKVTSAEIQHIARNWVKFKDVVTFYKDGKVWKPGQNPFNWFENPKNLSKVGQVGGVGLAEQGGKGQAQWQLYVEKTVKDLEAAAIKIRAHLHPSKRICFASRPKSLLIGQFLEDDRVLQNGWRVKRCLLLSLSMDSKNTSSR
jgi:hypothetical protein